MLRNLWLIPLWPLLGSLINGLWRRHLSETSVAYIACGAVGLSFFCSLVGFFALFSLPHQGRAVEVVIYQWVTLAISRPQWGSCWIRCRQSCF